MSEQKADAEFIRQFVADMQPFFTGDEDADYDADRFEQIAKRLEADPGRCKTCKSWDGKHRFCDNTDKLGGDASLRDDDSLVLQYDEAGGLRPGPKFGCIHHEPKP